MALALGKKGIGPEAVETVLGPNVRIEGTIHSDGSMRIDGQVQGSIECAGDVVIGNSARVGASVSAKCVVVAGQVLGNITAEKVELAKTAVVKGDIQCAQLSIEAGAAFSGKTVMDRVTNKDEQASE
ncbi:MAG: bactofilin family protein [Bacillota bacterium]